MEYRNPYRRHSAITLPKSHSWPKSEYIKNYTELDTENQGLNEKFKIDDNLHYEGLSFSGKTEFHDKYVRQSGEEVLKKKPVNQLDYGGLNFDLGTETDEYRPVTEGGFKQFENERPHDELSYHGLDFQGRSETKERFGRKQVEGFVKERPRSNIELRKASFDDRTEFIDEYQAKFGRRAATTSNIRSSNLNYNSESEEKPGTSKGLRTKSDGFSNYSSGTLLQYSAQFGRRAKLKPQIIQKFTMRSNLRSPGPEVKFEGSSEQKDNFTQKPVLKMEKRNHKGNIKTFDPGYLDDVKSFAKIR